MVKQVKDPDTIDFRSIASIPFGTRQKLLQSPSLLDVLSRELTPGQRAALFPNYYKDNAILLSGRSAGSSVVTTGVGGVSSGTGTMASSVSSGATDSASVARAAASKILTAEQKSFFSDLSKGNIDANSSRASFLNEKSPEQLAQMGIQKVTHRDGSVMYQQAAITDQQAIESLKAKASTNGSMTSRQKALLDVITSGESNIKGVASHDVTFGMGSGGKSQFTTPEKMFGKKLTDLTISEVRQYQKILRQETKAAGYGKTDSGKILGTSAVGRGQWVEGTLVSMLQAQGIKEEDFDKVKFTPELQDQLILTTALKKRGLNPENIEEWINDPKALKALGDEWESLSISRGKISRQQLQDKLRTVVEAPKGQMPGSALAEGQQPTAAQIAEEKTRIQEQQEQSRVDLIGTVAADEPSATPATIAAEQYADSASIVPPAGMQTSEFYNTMRAMTQEKIGPDDPIWDQVDPSLKKNKHMIVDAETKLVGRDALLSADAAAKVLRKNGYIPRPVSGGDNHSANHGRGRDANYSIDMAASVKDENGKITDVRLGSGVPYEVRRDMAIAAKLASEGSSTNFRVGFPNNDSNASMHLQQDPQRKEGLWGYDRRTAAGADASRFILETTGEGKRFISDMAAVSEMNKNDKDALLSNITGNAVPSSQSANTTEGEVEKIEKQEVPKPIEEKAQENQQAQASNAPGTVAVDSAATTTAPASTVTPVQQEQTTEGSFMSNMLAFADGGVINKPYIAQPVDGQGPNVLMGEAGSETVVPQKKIAAMEVGQQQYQKINQIAEARMTEIQQTPNVEVDNQKEAQRVSIQSGMSSPKPTVGVNVNHTVLPPSARKAYADSKLEPRLNGLTNIGSVYVNHGYT